MTVRILWTVTDHLTNTKQTTIKEKLSKNLEQFDSYNKVFFICYQYLTKYQKHYWTIPMQKRWKALKYKNFWYRKDLVTKPSWFGLQGLFTFAFRIFLLVVKNTTQQFASPIYFLAHSTCLLNNESKMFWILFTLEKYLKQNANGSKLSC